MVSLVLFMSFAHVLCNQYDARWDSKTKTQNATKWRNGGIINPLWGSENTTQLAKYLHVFYVKPSTKVYLQTNNTDSFSHTLTNRIAYI